MVWKPKDDRLWASFVKWTAKCSGKREIWCAMAKQVFKCRTTLGSTERYTRLWLIIAEHSPKHDVVVVIVPRWWSLSRDGAKDVLVLSEKVLIVKNAYDDEKRHRTLIYFDLWNWDLNETWWAGVCGNVSVFWQLSLVYKRKRIGSYAHNLSATLPANKSFKELWMSVLKSLRFPLICFYASLMADCEIWLNSECCRFI